MASENSTGNDPENGGPPLGLDLAQQVALQIELLRMAGVRFLPGDPAKLAGGPPVAQRKTQAVSNPKIPETAPGAFGSLADRVRLQQPAPPVPVNQPSISLPEPQIVPPARPVTPAPVIEKPAKLPTSSPSPAGLFGLEQVGTPADGLEELDASTRLERLEILRAQVAACQRCPALVAERTQTVFGVGPIDAELCVVGEAPGHNEDKLGEPFVGEAGQLLNKMLAACGIERSKVFICNILRCRPPANRQPQADEAASCNPFLVETLRLVRPKFLCLMGATATRYLLDQPTGIGVLRKRDLAWRGIPVQATYHPAYLLRYPDKKRDAWEDLQRMLARMGRTPPAHS